MQTPVRFVNGQFGVIVQVQDVFGSKLDVLGMCHIAKLRSLCPQPCHAAAPFMQWCSAQCGNKHTKAHN